MPLRNLAPQALRDLEAILERSAAKFGAEHATRFRRRIDLTCHGIALGLDLGHFRADVKRRRPTRFVVVGPLVIAYSPETKRVLRIVDGRRNVAKLLR